MNSFFSYFWEMLRTGGPWIVISFAVCGALHGVLRPEAFQRSLGNKKFSSIAKATISGMFLPICSCGVLPLAVGLYYSGAWLGPALAFLVAAPIINPAALILSYALLGPQISAAYLISGFMLPVIIGIIANKFGGRLTESAFAPRREAAFTNAARPPLLPRLINGLRWGVEDLAVQTCRFIIIGTLLAALLLALIPASFIQAYLSNPEFISIIGATILGAAMYVCAIAHIPFIAALVSMGASPGIALAFLIAGVSANLPGMISVWKLIGKRAVFIYAGTTVIFCITAGYAANLLFAESFVPQFDLSQSERGVQIAGYFNIRFPEAFKTACALAVALIGFYSWAIYFIRRFRRP